MEVACVPAAASSPAASELSFPYPPASRGCVVRDEVTAELLAQPVYATLRTLLVENLQTGPRRALSAHTTTECQPRKLAGPTSSLKSSGVETPIDTPDGIRVRLSLPSMFTAGDDLQLVYQSTPHRSLKLAQAQAAH